MAGKSGEFVAENVERRGFVDFFLQKNAEVNLSALRTPEAVREKHVLDSLEVLKLDIFSEGMKVLDVGTGGGFPLLPLARVLPAVERVGVDARKKKILKIREMIDFLGLGNCRAERGRVEDFAGKFDVVMARAVAHAEKLLPWVEPRLKKWGKIVLWKQKSMEEAAVVRARAAERGMAVQERNYSLGAGDIERVIWIVGN